MHHRGIEFRWRELACRDERARRAAGGAADARTINRRSIRRGGSVQLSRTAFAACEWAAPSCARLYAHLFGLKPSPLAGQRAAITCHLSRSKLIITCVRLKESIA